MDSRNLGNRFQLGKGINKYGGVILATLWKRNLRTLKGSFLLCELKAKKRLTVRGENK